MLKLHKVNLFARVIIFFLFLEFILQLISLLLLSKIKKQDSNRNEGFNIVCIGDSFTYGIGAPKQYSYPNQLKNLLNTIYPNSHINVINLGISGYNSSQCIKYLKEKFDFYNPKIVIILAGMNNCWNFLDSSYFRIKQFKYDNPLKYRIKFVGAFLSSLKTYKLIKITFLNLKSRLRSRQSIDRGFYLPEREFLIPKRTNKMQKLLNQGLKYWEDGKFELSEACYREALKLNPDDYEPHWYVGRFYSLNGVKEKAREELILAAKYAGHPYTVSAILVGLQDRRESRNSENFKEFSNLVKSLRSYWVGKFGEEYVQYFIDPAISYKETDLEKILFYDFEELINYLSQKKTKLVILSYPFHATQFRYPVGIYYRISNYLRVPLVDNVPLFDKYLKIYKREELFDTGGHCTSKGYGLIAENIYGVLKKHNLLPAN
ncbi:hypothetical protein FJZ17_03655 [Candidatus Pacearchaeota archaeon]|nr:hypothetical protein [Candidatus Pacearchaeota archaeon]